MSGTKALLLLVASVFLLFTIIWFAGHDDYVAKAPAFLEKRPTQSFISTTAGYPRYSDGNFDDFGRLIRLRRGRPPPVKVDVVGDNDLVEEGDVVVLREKNFGEFIANNRYVMVVFYAPWCYWSQRLLPTYAETATILKGEVVLAKVDATQETELARKYKIQGYPSLYWFIDGVHEDTYYGDRSKDAMAAWLRKKRGPGVHNVTTMEDAARILTFDSVVVLALLDRLESADSEELIAASKVHVDVNFYQTTSTDVATMFHIELQIKRPVLVLLRSEGEQYRHFVGQFTRSAIADFIYLNKHPWATISNTEIAQLASSATKVSKYSDEYFNNIMLNRHPMLHLQPVVIDETDVMELNETNFSQFIAKNRYVMVNFYAPWCYWSKQLVPAYAAAATALKGEVVLAKVDGSKDKKLARKYDIKEFPTLYLFYGGVLVGRYCNDRSEDAMVTWIKKKIGHGIYSLTTTEEAKHLLTADSAIVLGFLDSLEGLDSKELVAASKLHDDVNFFQTASADVAKMFHIDPMKWPSLVMLKWEAQNYSHFDGQFTRSAIADFVALNKPSLMKTSTINYVQLSSFTDSDADDGFGNLILNKHHTLLMRPANSEADVVVLSKNNFSQFVAKNQYVLVNFYAPWCYWSQRLEPEYAAAATMLKGEAVLAKVDVTQEGELAHKYNIRGYPTLYLFVDGILVDCYYEERSRDAMATWVRKKMSPSIYSLATTDEAESLLTADFVVVLGFLDNLEGPDSKELVAASKLQIDVTFYQTASVDVAKMFHIDPQIKRPALVMVKKGPEKFSHFDGIFTRSAIADFISVKLPSVTNFTSEKAHLIFKNPMKQLWLFVPTYGSRRAISIFQEAATVLKGKLLFVHAKMGYDDVGRQLAYEFGVTSYTPTVVAYEAGNGEPKMYVYNSGLTFIGIKSFGEDFLEDKLISDWNPTSDTVLKLPSHSYASDLTSFERK